MVILGVTKKRKLVTDCAHFDCSNRSDETATKLGIISYKFVNISEQGTILNHNWNTPLDI